MGQRLTFLVVLVRPTKMKKAIVVPSKGSKERYVARQVLVFVSAFSGESGDKDQIIIHKTDQEPAIKFLVDDVCMARTGAKTMLKGRPLLPKVRTGSRL